MRYKRDIGKVINTLAKRFGNMPWPPFVVHELISGEKKEVTAGEHWKFNYILASEIHHMKTVELSLEQIIMKVAGSMLFTHHEAYFGPFIEWASKEDSVEKGIYYAPLTRFLVDHPLKAIYDRKTKRLSKV